MQFQNRNGRLKPLQPFWYTLSKHTYIHTYIHTYVHWVKAHVGTYGNELADQLAKAAAQKRDALISYKKIPKGTLICEIEEETNKMAKRVEWMYQCNYNESILSKLTEQA